MYLWSFAIGDAAIYGRTWEEFRELLDFLCEKLTLSINRRIIVYVHNLSHEMSFIIRRFRWYKTFCLRERKPIYAVTDTGIEFRCSYILTSLSLENVAKSLNSNLRKRIGDLDYSKVRHTNTPLTVREIIYSLTDVLIVTAHIAKCIADEGGDISKIPLTKTGYVRRYCRRYVFYGKPSEKRDKKQYQYYRSLMQGLSITPEEYPLLKRAFTGAFTHASCQHVMRIFENVASYDFNSSYPTVMIAEQFPMGRGQEIFPKSMRELEKYFKQYCVIFNVRFSNLKSKIFYEHYLSKSKCVIDGVPIVDNGRIVQVDGTVTTTITNVDWEIISLCYEWDSVAFSSVYAYRKGYLPTAFVNSVLDLYENKTKLKNVEGEEDFYLKQKEMLNSCYGMTVCDILKPLVSIIDGNFIVQPITDIAEAIEKNNNNRSRFLYYPWGLFITAYARRNLWSGITHLKYDYLYSDTDSVKVINYKKHIEYFEEYNKNIIKKLQKACDFHNIPYERISPKTKDGVEKPLGVWDFEGVYKRFKTLGAKRYLTETQDGILKMTVAGVGKKAGVEYLTELSNGDNARAFELFDDDLYFPRGKAGKMTITYLDYETRGTITDYLGNVGEYHELTSAHLEPAEYSLSIWDEFLKFLETINPVDLN